MFKPKMIEGYTKVNAADLTGMELFVLSGFKNSGKDTVAGILQKFIQRNHKGITPKIISFADPITNCVNQIFNSGRKISYDNKEQRNNFWSSVMGTNVTQRNLLIDFGEFMRKHYGADLWNMVVLHKLLGLHESHQKKVIIPDLRYHREIEFLEYVKSLGAKVQRVLVLRKKSLPEWVKMGLSLTDPVERDIIFKDFRPHPSEIEWCDNSSPIQYVIKNDGTIFELEAQIKKVFGFAK